MEKIPLTNPHPAKGTGASTTLVIINYNDGERLGPCLESLRSCGCPVMVFDNHSTDGSAAQVRAHFPWVHLVESSVNTGYGTAANRALAMCGTPYAILSNSDVVFLEDSVEALERCLAENPRVAIAGPRLLNADSTLQRSCFAWPGGLAWWFDNDVAAPLVERLPGMKGRLWRAWDHQSERQPPWIKGAVMALRLAAVEELQGFDENFYMYHEESDLCLRAANTGWKVHFTPAAEVIHFGGSSTGKVGAAMAFELVHSTLRFALKHYPPLHARLLWLTWKAIVLGRILRDECRLLGAGSGSHRSELSENLQAWKRAFCMHYGALARKARARGAKQPSHPRSAPCLREAPPIHEKNE